jgi:hypothetical protein
MYLLYLDESDTGLEEPNVARFYCLVGVRVVDSSYRTATTRIQRLVSQLIPAPPPRFEIKGADLYHGTGHWRGRAPADRVTFSTEFANLLGSLNIKIYAAFKPSENFTDDYLALLEHVLGAVAADVAHRGSASGRQLLSVFDRRTDITLPGSEALRDLRSELVRRHAAACPFVDHGYETDSKDSLLTQAADFCAYFLRKQRTVIREPDLFGDAENALAIAAIDEICRLIEPKTRVLADVPLAA